MHTAHFRILEHTIPATLVRQHRRATAGKLDKLRLAVKQYQPLIRLNQRDQVTIIGAHANAFPKELYEPLWDDVFQNLHKQGIGGANIFIADVATQGASGELNRHLIRDDTSCMDHPRDLFLMVNHFRDEMASYIVGIGHSMGGNNLVNLSLMHPALLSSLVLIDPVMQAEFNDRALHAARLSSNRRDKWPSLQAAADSFKKSEFYKSWDPRVLERWIQFGLRDDTQGSVELRTTKEQEILSLVRPNMSVWDKADSVDLVELFERPAITETYKRLGEVLPGTLYIHGGASPVSPASVVDDRVRSTGTYSKGSGGIVAGRVENVTIKGVGHLVPMETVGNTAGAISDWVKRDLEYSKTAEKRTLQVWRDRDVYTLVERALRGTNRRDSSL